MMTDDVIRLREEIAEQIKVFKGMKEMAAIYGYDISKPAKDAKEAVQWLYFGYLADHGAVGYLIGNTTMVTVVKNGKITFPAGCSGTVSVFCMGKDAEGVTETGLFYGIEDGVFTSGFPLGVSNHFTGKKAEISVKNGSLRC